jgi:hypothetical protein
VSPPRQRGFCLPASVRRHGPPAAPWGTILSRAPSRCGGVPRAGRWQHMARRDCASPVHHRESGEAHQAALIPKDATKNLNLRPQTVRKGSRCHIIHSI